MKTRLAIFYSILMVMFFLPIHVAQAQSAQVSGTQHGVELTWNAAGQGSDTNAVAGYFIFRCTGTGATCVNTSPVGWLQLNSTPNVPVNYLDLASDNFVNGTSYTYSVQTVDTKGNTSGFSPTSTVLVPSTGFPVNPNATTAPTAAVQ